MLDIKFIADNTDWVKKSLGRKGFPAEKVDELLAVFYEMNKLKTSSQALAEEKNKLSNSIKSASNDERPSIIAKSKEIGEQFKLEQEKLSELQAKFEDMMLRMPNYPSEDSPDGPDDSANVVRRKVGELPHFDFTPRDHIELMEINDWGEIGRAHV